eukprot:SAG31_NODE_470_length_15239_cov_19.376288_6_plen_66_part_00
MAGPRPAALAAMRPLMMRRRCSAARPPPRPPPRALRAAHLKCQLLLLLLPSHTGSIMAMPRQRQW